MSNSESRADRPSIGAVLVNWNAGQHLIDAVESLKAEGIDEVVVVDNGSKDDSMDLLREQFPDVPLIQLPNPGFGTGVNRGVIALKSEYIFSVNPDTVVKPGTVDKLLETLQSDPNIAMVGPRLENPDGTLYPSARRFPPYVDAIGHAVLGMVKPDNRWSRSYKNLDIEFKAGETREVDWISGAAMFARRNAWDSVGGFDQSFFMYMEDVDLCWRLKRSGWKIVYRTDVSVVHVGGVSTSKVPYRMLMAHHRSLLRYTKKTAAGWQRVLLPFLSVGIVARLPLMCAHHWKVTRKAKRQG